MKDLPDVHLAGLQTWMQAALMLSGPLPTREDIDRLIAPSPTLSARQRLAIYQQGYYTRLVQCMESQFKALYHTLGKDLFDDFCREYLKQYPSQSPTLSALGARFSHFLNDTRPDKDAEEKEVWVDFMIDLARFEWDLYLVFDAEGQEGKPYADDLSPDESLGLQPCFYLREYRFPVSPYYHAVAQGNDPEIPDAGQDWVAFVRKNFRIGIFSLSAPQFTFLQEMNQGRTVAEAIHQTGRFYQAPLPEIQSAWAMWKATWLDAGFFITRR